MLNLTESDRAAVREALAAKTFDEALHLTPEAALEAMMGELPSDAHDFFGTDMFPNGVPKPLDPEQRGSVGR